jgi:hypothetical protein
MSKKILFVLLFLASVLALGSPVQKPPLVIIVSGGMATCADETAEKMEAYLQPFAIRAQKANYPVKFIVTCFSKLREDMQYYSVDYHGVSSAVQRVPGGKHFDENFQAQFIKKYLDKEIPKNAKVILAGQSHGGWVALSIAATRPVDFVATLDPISRLECNAKSVIGLRALKRLKTICLHPASEALLDQVGKKIEESHGTFFNTYQDASILHSSALNVPWAKDLNFGSVNSDYESIDGKHELNAKKHRALATDPEVWKRILAQLDRKLASLDPDWIPNREKVVANSAGPTPLINHR